MSLGDVMEADASIFFGDGLAVEVEYNGQTLEVILEYGDDRASGNTFSGDGQAARAKCWIRASDLEERPEPLDSVVIDEETWQVTRVLERDGGIWGLELIGRETVWG
jgi:hypothetical protein